MLIFCSPLSLSEFHTLCVMGHHKCCMWMGQQGMGNIVYVSSAHTYSPLSRWMSLIKHPFKDKIIKSFEKWQQSIKSSTVGKSNYASMLFWRKGKQCGIFLEFPFPLFPRLFILSSEFPEETEATRGCSFFPYPIVIIIYEKNLGCPVQRTLRMDTRVSCSSSP